MRIAGWEDALARVIEKHSQLPFEYGVSDCGQLAADAVLAVTGKDIFKKYRSYKTETGAAKVLRKAGCETLADLFAKHLEPVHVFSAKRGDIGVTEYQGQICAGVFTGTGFAGKSENGVFHLTILEATQAFSVN